MLRAPQQMRNEGDRATVRARGTRLTQPAAPAPVGAWPHLCTGAWIATVCFVAILTSGYRADYADMGVALPIVTEGVLLLGAGLGVGLFPFALVLGLAPLALAPGARALRRWFVLGTVHAGLSAAGAWAACRLPLVMLFEDLGWVGDRSEDVADLEPKLLAVVGAAWLLSTLAVAATWLELTVHTARLPRGRPGLEAARVGFIALLPATVLPLITGAVVSELRLRFRGPLLVPPEVAAGGTVALIVVGLVVWLRARAPAP